MVSPVNGSASAPNGSSKAMSSSPLPAAGNGFPGVPSPAPAFFPNPFLAPFLPQPTTSNGTPSDPVATNNTAVSATGCVPAMNGLNLQQMQAQFQQFAAMAAAAAASGAAADGGSGDCRVNPFTGGLFLPPNQYQEVMQQYLQTLMMQAGSGFPSNQTTTPSMLETPNGGSPTFPGPNQSPSPPLALNDPAAAAFHGLATLNLGQINLASPTTSSSPSVMTAVAASASLHSTPSKVSTASVGVVSSAASTNCSSSPSPSFSMINSDVPKDHVTSVHDLMASLPTGSDADLALERSESEPRGECESSYNAVVNGNGGDKNEESTNEAMGFSAETPSASVPSTSDTNGDKKQDVSDGAATKASKEAENVKEEPKSKFDARADELFRKQMYEIEQEINRRIQNRHVRKLNEEEMSQLLSETGFANFVEAGRPNSDVSQQMGHLIAGDPTPPLPPPAKPSLNQLRSSFNPPEAVPEPLAPEPPLLPMQTAPAHTAALPFSFGNVTMAQPPPAPVHSSAFLPSSSSLYPVQTEPALPVDAGPSRMSNGLGAVMPNPSSITPEMAALLLKQIQETNPQLLSSLGLVQAPKVKDEAELYRLPAPPSAQTTVPIAKKTLRHTGSGDRAGAEENGWRQLEKRHIVNGEPLIANGTAPSSTGQADNNKENASQEPVWVMRDSYLKRLQREEQRSKEMQNGTPGSSANPALADEEQEETDKLLNRDHNAEIEEQIKTKKTTAPKKEVMVHEPAVLIEGVLFRARYLGSTQLTCDGRPTKSSRMAQAQEAVSRVKAPEGEIQPSTEIDLFISTEKIMVLNTDLQDILMDHALRSISYIADIGDLVVLMARRMPQNGSCSDEEDLEIRRTPRVICHVFESEEASFIAQSIGQAFQVAYVEFLRANGIDDPAYLREIDYQEVLNSQELLGEELDLFSNKETQKDIVVPKKVGEPLGIVVVESGWGSMLPTVVVAKMEPHAPASRSNQLNIGDQIIAINGISLVGLPLAKAQQNIKNAKTSTAVRLTVVSTPPVVEVRIKRPDTKYQLGFSVQNGVICSLLRGGIAERGGIRVGHRIIEINHRSVVAVPHEKIVNMLATATGEIHMKTMPTSMFRLLTGQEVPNYI